MLHTKHKEFFCVDDLDVLVIQAASRTMNPTLDEQEIAKAFADDPSAARAEWGGEFRDDISGFVDADIVSRIRLSDKTSRLRPRPVAAKRG